MPIAATHLVTSGSGTDDSSYATASISPTNGRPVLAWILNQLGTDPPTTPTLTGNGQVWTQEATITWGVATPFYRMTLFSNPGSSPSAGAVTIAFGGVTQLGCDWSISEFADADTADPVVQAVTGNATGTSGSITLAAFGSASNATAGCFGLRLINETMTEGAGFAILGQNPRTAPATSIGSEFRNDNDTTVDMSWTTSVRWGGIAVEIRAGAAPSLTYARQRGMTGGFREMAGGLVG